MKHEFALKELKCMGCAAEFTKKMEGQKGIQKIDFKIKEHKVVLEVDPQILNDQKVREALGQQGYTIIE